MKDVLILIPTNKVKEYCVGKFMKGLANMDLGRADVLFSDDTVTDEPFVGELPGYKQFIEANGYECLSVDSTLKSARSRTIPVRERLCNARELLRTEFLKREGYTHAFWLDSDIIAPKNTLDQMMSWGKDVVSGVYHRHTIYKANEHSPHSGVKFDINVFKFSDRECWEMANKVPQAYFSNFAGALTQEDINPSRLIPEDDNDFHIAAVGLGCLLMSRAAMSAPWKFRYHADKAATEDMWLSLDLKKLGFNIYVDGYIRCRHYPKPWEGKI